jgi:hypothetical protein
MLTSILLLVHFVVLETFVLYGFDALRMEIT